MCSGAVRSARQHRLHLEYLAKECSENYYREHTRSIDACCVQVEVGIDLVPPSACQDATHVRLQPQLARTRYLRCDAIALPCHARLLHREARKTMQGSALHRDESTITRMAA